MSIFENLFNLLSFANDDCVEKIGLVPEVGEGGRDARVEVVPLQTVPERTLANNVKICSVGNTWVSNQFTAHKLQCFYSSMNGVK